MRILTRYIFGEFIKIFILVLTASISLYLIIDVVENMGKLIEHHIPFGDGLRFFLYKAPFIFYQISPVAVLMATLLSLGIFAKYNEVIAAMAQGIHIARFALPFFASAAVISGFNFILNESVIPSANQKVIAVQQIIEGTNEKTQFARDSLWFRDNRDIYSINYIDPQKGVLKGLTIYTLDNDFNIVKRVDAREVNWMHGRWIATESIVSSFQQGRLVDEARIKENVIPLAEKPDDLKNVERLADEMSFRELLRYVQKLKREGYEATRYMVDLHAKLSFPFVSMIMVMMGMPFALKSGRHGGIAVGVGLSIIIGFSYWVVFAITTTLGYNGIIPPFLAAWLTNIVFAGFGILMLTLSETPS